MKKLRKDLKKLKKENCRRQKESEEENKNKLRKKNDLMNKSIFSYSFFVTGINLSYNKTTL